VTLYTLIPENLQTADADLAKKRNLASDMKQLPQIEKKLVQTQQN